MPELPEVETTRRGIEPHIATRTITAVKVRDARLRWPVPPDLADSLVGRQIVSVARRGKYLLLDCDGGHLIVHLGMSGSLRVVEAGLPADTHDHVDIVFDHGRALRLRDPRRFGAVLWTTEPPGDHPLLAAMGPEPLGEAFTADYLYQRSRGRKAGVKQFIMDGQVVVGVGNIYANEALFRSGIRPGRAAGRISRARYQLLWQAIRDILAGAIAHGGTTLRDFVDGSGKPGYFRQQLQVYGRGGEDCTTCGTVLVETRQGQRSTVYCPVCQR